jgi:hypothetical protein
MKAVVKADRKAGDKADSKAGGQGRNFDPHR